MGYLRSLSPRWEFALVLLIAFGYPTLVSFVSLAVPIAQWPISGGSLRALLVIVEPIVLLLLGWFLHIRGWTLPQLGLGRPRPSALLLGIGLCLVWYVVYRELWYGLWQLAPELMRAAPAAAPAITPGLSATAVVIVSLLNPIFEEVFVCGYIISVLAKPGRVWPAIHASVAVRLLYHLYQGPVGIIGIIPIGLLFAGYFARSRQLWPVLIAHALLDFIGLAAFIG
jgi:membrane protease YdiL (CAAX protease family)